MKSILIHLPENADPARIEEGIRVAAGLSQQPGLQVALELPSAPLFPFPPQIRSYLELFAEKGLLLQAGPGWSSILPPTLHPCSPSSTFDIHIPF